MQLRPTYTSPAGTEPRFFLSEHLNEEAGYTYYFMIIGEQTPTGLRQTLVRLTDAEYALKDSDTARLAVMAKLFAEKLPGDRVIEASIVNPENPALREDVKQVKCPTVDMFHWIAWEEARRISEQEVVYVLNSAMQTASGSMPSVDMSGRAHVYLERADIDKQIADLPAMRLCVGEYRGEAITDEISRMRRFGIEAFLLHRRNGPVQIPCALVPECNDHTRNIAGRTALQALRYVQQVRTPDPSEELKAGAATSFNMLLHGITSEPLLASFLYEGESEDSADAKGDRVLHIAQSAAALMTARKGHVFFGAEDYILPVEPDRADRKVSFRTLMRADVPDKRFLAVFTDMKELHAMYGTGVRVAVLGFDEIMSMRNAGGIAGIVIDPKGLNLIMGEKELDAAVRERNEPMKIFAYDKASGKVKVQLLGSREQIERAVKEKNLDPSAIRQIPVPGTKPAAPAKTDVPAAEAKPVTPVKAVEPGDAARSVTSAKADAAADAAVPAAPVTGEVDPAETDSKDEVSAPKKKGFFGRLFGKKS